MLSLFLHSAFSLAWNYAYTTNPMSMRSVTTLTRQIASKTLSSNSEIASFLTQNGIGRSIANSFGEKMRFSTKSTVIEHTFRVDGQSYLEWRTCKRISMIISAEKVNGKYTVSISTVTGNTQIQSTETQAKWQNFLFWKIWYSKTTVGRPLTAAEISSINTAIDSAVRNKINNLIK